MAKFWPWDVSAEQEALNQTLGRAVQKNDVEGVRQALSKGAMPNLVWAKEFKSLLTTAVKAKRWEVVELLQGAGATPTFPLEWVMENPSDPMAKDGTVVTTAACALAQALKDKDWEYVERCFKDPSVRLDALMNSERPFESAVMWGVPGKTLDVMLHHARLQKVECPSMVELLTSALNTTSQKLVEEVARRCMKPGRNKENSEALAPPVVDRQAWAAALTAYLRGNDVEYSISASGFGRVPVGTSALPLLRMWVDQATPATQKQDLQQLLEWTNLAVFKGVEKLLVRGLLPLVKENATQSWVETWVQNGLQSVVNSAAVWGALDKVLGQASVSKAIVSVDDQGLVWPLLEKRVSLSTGKVEATLAVLQRVQEAGLKVSEGSVFRMFNTHSSINDTQWRSCAWASRENGPLLAKALMDLGWEPTQPYQGIAWEDRFEGEAFAPLRALLRSLTLDSRWTNPQRSRSGPRL